MSSREFLCGTVSVGANADDEGSGVTSSYLKIKDPANLTLLSVTVVLMPCFVIWVGRQERLGRPAIVPNSLWRKADFTSVCITVFLTWAGFNAFGYFATLLYAFRQDAIS